MLRRIHGAIRHVGKSPGRDADRVEKRRALGQLQDELERAVEREDFERAAELRDHIGSLESGGTPGATA